MHISNYISPRTALLKVQWSLSIRFFSLSLSLQKAKPIGEGKKNSIFSSEMCGGSSQLTNQLACYCLTNWPLTFHRFGFDRFLDKSYYIRSALKLTARLWHIQCISQAVANCGKLWQIGKVAKWQIVSPRAGILSFHRRGGAKVFHYTNRSDQNSFELVRKVEEPNSFRVDESQTVVEEIIH